VGADAQEAPSVSGKNCLPPKIDAKQFAEFVRIFVPAWKCIKMAEIKAKSRSQEEFVTSLSRSAQINP